MTPQRRLNPAGYPVCPVPLPDTLSLFWPLRLTTLLGCHREHRERQRHHPVARGSSVLPAVVAHRRGGTGFKPADPRLIIRVILV
jgi:hypothetical protein